MKKTITLSIAALTAFTASAQLPVSTVAGKKQALIEEFTGNTCGFCPDGHKISDQITSSLPGKAFAINYHVSSYATPAGSAASKDFRTSDGTAVSALANMKITGYPAGAVNRQVPATSSQSQSAGGYAMSRSYWSSNVNTIITQNAYVNIAGQAYVHPTTRQMYVYMEAYYTATAPVTTPKISLALIQDDIIAYQGGGSSYYPAMLQTAGNNDTYKHNHALRDIISAGATGETMTGPVTAGTKWTKTFTYTVAATYPASGTKTIAAVLADLELIAFITETTDKVIAVCKVPIVITTSADIFGATTSSDLVSFVNVYPNPMANEGVIVYTLPQSNDVSINIVNALGQTVISDKLDAQVAGEHKYNLDATSLSNGVYLVNIKVGESTITKKISVLK